MYKKSTYLEEPDDVKYSTNTYMKDNDHFLEYFETKLEVVEDPKSVISKKSVYSDFKAWFKEYHEGNKLPRSEQLYRFLDDVLGKSNRSGWKNVTFRAEEGDDSDEEGTNDLDI